MFNPIFIQSIDFKSHPILLCKSKLKVHYYTVLEYTVQLFANNDEYTNARLNQYQTNIVGNTKIPTLNSKKIKRLTKSLVNNRIKPWRKAYRYWLVCDIATILFNESRVIQATTYLKDYLSKRQSLVVDILLKILFNDPPPPYTETFNLQLAKQFRSNRIFSSKPEIRYIVTANVSAGKSTLINALVGKPVTRTSQEICTGNLCYIYNKPFEDDRIHLSGSPPNLNANPEHLTNLDQSKVNSIALHFKISQANTENRICIIDTPGVNSAIHKNHREITRQRIKQNDYNKLIYVLNANRLGTDEEKDHLLWVSKNVEKTKVLFVLNKLDDFKKIDDSVIESITKVKNDLLALGYKNPEIFPISSYFAYLIKRNESDIPMPEDELDSFNLYVKKFSKDGYDLSIYSTDKHPKENESENFRMKIRSGLYSLEKALFKGARL